MNGARQLTAFLEGQPLRANWPQSLSLIEDLRRVADIDDVGLVFVREDGTEQRCSYRQLVGGAESVLSGLRGAGVARGSLALLQFGNDGAALLTAFWGCLLAGCTPVLMDSATAENGSAGAAKFAALLDEMPELLIVTDDATALALRALREIPSHQIVRVATRSDMAPSFADWFTALPDDTAVLLMTSGSQGGIKLVQQTHRAIRSMVAATVQSLALGRDEVAYNWMPVTHVGGLVFLHLLPVCMRYNQVHVTTGYVIEQPVRWVELASRYGVTMSWAPNFAFRLIADAAVTLDSSLDLSSLRIIANGGEPISGGVASLFVQRLRPLGLPATAIRPSFGMSECCSGLTWSSYLHGESKTEERRVALGFPIPGTRIRIVNDDGVVLSHGEAGQIEIGGVTLFSGYYGNTQLTRDSLRNGWFRTGDVGYVCAGGLVVTGRVKEQIIISGLKFSPHDIETAAEQCDGVLPSYTAAVAVPSVDGEATAVFFVPLDGFDPAEVSERVRMHILRRVGIRPDHVLPLDREKIPKTSTGKIRKSELVEQYRLAQRTGPDAGASSPAPGKTLPAWFYTTAVRRRNLVNVSPDPGASPIVLICSDAHWGRSLCENITALGCPAHLVAPCEQGTPERPTTGTSSRGSVEVMLRRLRDAGICPRRVVFVVRASIANAQAAASAVHASCLDVVLMLSNIRAGMHSVWGSEHRWSLVAVTVEAGGSQNVRACEAAVAAGMLRCISQESPDVATKCVETDSTVDTVQDLAVELVSKINDPEVIFRGTKRFITSLSPMIFEDAVHVAAPWRSGGIYVVTGGLGGIGRILTQYLLQTVQARVLIIGRGAQTAADAGSQGRNRALQALQRSRQGGADLIYRPVDVADANQVEQAMLEATAMWGGGVDGIVHLAGVRRPGETAEDVEAVLLPKVLGSFILANALERHGARRDQPTFVHFSSVLARFGASGEGAYSAASSFQHAFAAACNANGRVRHYSIGWSAWDGIGMSSDGDALAVARAKGFATLTPEQGLLSLLTILSRDVTDVFVGLDGGPIPMLGAGAALPDRRLAVAVSGGSPNKWAVRFRDPFGTNVPVELRAIREIPRIAGGAIDRMRLRRLMVGDGPGLEYGEMSQTEVQIASIWTAVLRVSDVGAHSNFFSIGGDSMRATQAMARIGTVFGRRFTVRTLFDHPTLRMLSAEVDRRLSEGSPGGVAVRKKPGTRSALSFAQGRLWFLSQLHHRSASYNIVGAFLLTGPLDVPALTHAFRTLIERHEALRTIFVVDGADEPRQITCDSPDTVLSIEESPDPDAGTRNQVIHRAIAAELSHVFDLASGPLFRASLVRLDEDQHVLCLNMHHIVSDGWSFRILFGELSALYRAAVRGAATILPAIEHRYFDFVDWQNRWLEKVGAGQLDYWRQQLRGLQRTRLTRIERSASPQGALFRETIDAELVARIEGLCDRTNMTLFMALLAALGIAICEHTGENDIAVGAAVANRTRAEWEPIVGFFVNTLVMRVSVDPRATIAQFMQGVREVAKSAYANQDVPFEQVVEALNPVRSADGNPLFSVMMVLQPEVETFDLEGVDVRRIDHHAGGAKFDILFSFHRVRLGLDLIIEYDTGLFSEDLVRRFQRRIAAVLSSLCDAELACEIGAFMRNRSRSGDVSGMETGVF